MSEGIPTNSTGTGNIAGMGVGPDGDPGMNTTNINKYKRKNRKNQPKTRKTFKTFFLGKN